MRRGSRAASEADDGCDRRMREGLSDNLGADKASRAGNDELHDICLIRLHGRQ